MTERAQRVMDALLKYTEHPEPEYVNEWMLANALRELVNQLKYIGITEKNILELADELEAL
jgi:hypothetical protein